jgi:nitrogen fixation/metabolism regulation signal transduction histidine kinase
MEDWRVPLSFRLKLMLAFALVSTGAIAVVAGLSIRQSFSSFRASDQRAADSTLRRVASEIDSRGQELERRVSEIASSDVVLKLAVDANVAAHVDDAAELARNSNLDYLEMLRSDGTIISSAHWPARYGYKELGVPLNASQPFVGTIETQSGHAKAIIAVRRASVSGSTVFVIAGTQLLKVLTEADDPQDAQLWLFDAQEATLSATSAETARNAPTTQVVTKRLADKQLHFADEQRSYFALPLRSARGDAETYVLVGRSLAPQRAFVRNLSISAISAILISLAASMLLATLIARGITRPVEELAFAAANVSAGDWNETVQVHSRDEIGQLAASFNEMTSQLANQRERLVQVERVAAWRELARRLAHELKNPLFPLQLTLETLVKARERNSPEFPEIFKESTRTLQQEIGHLKDIVQRFSDFSKMPTPEITQLDVNELLSSLAKLHAAELASREKPIELSLQLANEPLKAGADPVLLRRAIENLVLNAIDAMPQGGKLSIRSQHAAGFAHIEISDTGVGLTREEWERLFTPYYTTKQHGTGLGLAIVQSIVSDHGGRISVRSQKGKGTTFTMEIPKTVAKAARR